MISTAEEFREAIRKHKSEHESKLIGLTSLASEEFRVELAKGPKLSLILKIKDVTRNPAPQHSTFPRSITGDHYVIRGVILNKESQSWFERLMRLSEFTWEVEAYLRPTDGKKLALLKQGEFVLVTGYGTGGSWHHGSLQEMITLSDAELE